WGDEKGNVRRYDLEAGKQLPVLSGMDAKVYAVAFAPGGKLLAAGAFDKIKLWDSLQGTELASTASGFAISPRSAIFSRDGKFLVVGALSGDIKVWEVSALLKGKK